MIRKLILVGILCAPIYLCAQNTYVATPSMGGADLNSGSITSPYATVNKALSVMNAGDTCFIREGEYHEEVTIDSKSQLTILPFMNEFVIFDGTNSINTTWTPFNGNIYKTSLSKHIWQLFVDQQEMVMARWPNGNFSDLPNFSKLSLSLGMLLGRLELFAVLVLFFPAFWKN